MVLPCSDLHRTRAMSSSPSSESSSSADSTPRPAEAKTGKKREVKTKTPRPDELSKETFEFITAVDDYKRRHMRSFLDDLEILNILYSLGYDHPEFAAQPAPEDQELERFQAARKRYRDEEGRLFPTWSELFTILTELGYAREDLPLDEEPETTAEAAAGAESAES